jgi:putative salt-induced outer membrane protein YdiY
LSLTGGNSQASSLSFTFAADGPINESQTMMWANKAVYLYGEMEGETSVENLLLSSRIDWLHTDRFYSYYELQGIRDRFKNHGARLLPAGGAGYKLIATEKVTLGLDGGLSFVFTKYYDTGDTDNFTALKLGEQLVWKITETSEFNEKLEVLPKLSDFGWYFLRLEANLVAALAKSWSIKLTFIDSYDNHPVGLGIRKNDVAFIAALSRKF